MKGILIIALGFLFDAIPFLVGLVIFAIFAFPGTLTGALVGCAAGQQFFGDEGCKYGAVILSFLGTFANGEVALISAPIGAVVSIVIVDCINIVLGALFIFILAWNRMFYLPYMFMGAIKIVPGFNLFPWWATVAYLSVKKKEKGKKAAEEIITRSKNSGPNQVQGPRTRWGRRPIQPQFTPESAPPAPPSKFKQEPAPSLDDLKRAGIKYTEQPKPAPSLLGGSLSLSGPETKRETTLLGVNSVGGYRTPGSAANRNGEEPNTMATFRPVASNENRTWSDVRAGKGQKYQPMESRVTVQGGASENLKYSAPPTAANTNQDRQNLQQFEVPEASNNNNSWSGAQANAKKGRIDNMNAAI
jgi:hypothetical protein